MLQKGGKRSRFNFGKDIRPVDCSVIFKHVYFRHVFPNFKIVVCTKGDIGLFFHVSWVIDAVFVIKYVIKQGPSKIFPPVCQQGHAN